MRTQIGETSRARKGSRAAVVTSLVLHASACILVAILLVMKTDVYQRIEAMDIVWMDEIVEPQQVKRRLKINVDRRLDDPDKLMEQARNQLTEIRELPERVVERPDIHIEQVEPLMTAADLALSTDVTLLERVGSVLGVPGGKGQAPGRAGPPRPGSRLGGGGNGLLGGGGSDPLDIIDFLRERGDGGRIVYVLDVSSSMVLPGMDKLGLAKESVIDHMYLLSEQDEFSIVTFAGHISHMEAKPVIASAENLEAAEAYLGTFTPATLPRGAGTNTLGALQAAFAMGPDVVVFLTDGDPRSGQGVIVETNPEKIISQARASNRTDAALYIVALELSGAGALLLRTLAEDAGGRFKLVDRDELLLYKARMVSAPTEPTLPN
jgi:Mg-chelatase subunit ChlD